MNLTLDGDVRVVTNGDGGLFGPAADPTAGAVFSPDLEYRYRLWRRLPVESSRRCVFLMLNPSTADAFVLDATVRRCMGYAEREGCGELWVVNLFAWRSTDPKILKTLPDPVGPANDEHIVDTCLDADLVICGWGAEPFARRRATGVEDMLENLGVPLWRLGSPVGNGAPAHPLYLPGTVRLERHWEDD